MSAYFSNHSQSRFLPTTTPNSHPPSNTTSSTPSPSNSSSNGLRSRVPSRHFASSISIPSEQRSSISSSTNGVATVHPLRNTWVFWFRQTHPPGSKVVNYEEGIKKISSFSSIESYWSLWTHLQPPSTLQPTTDYLLFHTGVRRPVWEDPLNISGGKWIIRLKKGVADRLWEELIIAVIGDQFSDCGDPESGENDPPEICGCTISVRHSEDIVSVWNRNGADQRVTGRIRDTMRRVLNLPANTIMEYKSNNDSLQDRSSFRNSAIDRGSDR
ncbi:eukaryotic translation initiation factor 4E [Sistotremastrum niveocremeum HHB9708]|uniref:Eukaryotic translation initiation factor 4E n=2 Tax=Sistotremastraceae TaxID=3402574 RepID=A0A164VYQ2_9AGAM|nr:eukaryotic translation initiation factor 4E [Sistotremastrum niveocremeum HHB9708]KZT43258.1 eukaryotic translation initiation factor 4E [Sistotremastrum suecicum HHB10207 ss-3]